MRAHVDPVRLFSVITVQKRPAVELQNFPGHCRLINRQGPRLRIADRLRAPGERTQPLVSLNQNAFIRGAFLRREVALEGPGNPRDDHDFFPPPCVEIPE